MAFDAPATIAILGAGPIGLEAALYARFLGYDVLQFDKGQVGDSIRRWGHVRLFTPFRMNHSPLAIAAQQAQDPDWQPPDAEAMLTGNEYVEQFLKPLAATDLLVDSLHLDTKVLAVGRGDALKGDLVGDEHRAEQQFQILTRNEHDGEVLHQADIVIDCSGTYTQHNHLGQGGLPAIGERHAASDIGYHIPDVLGAERERFAGHSVLVVGGGYSAATTIVALADVARQTIGTHVEWVTRRERSPEQAGPIRRIDDDPLGTRDQLAKQANQLADHEHGGSVQHRDGSWIERIEWGGDHGRHRVHFAGKHGGLLEVDRVVALVGYRPDREIYRELQVHECFATEGPMRLAAQLQQAETTDCLQQPETGPEALLNPEPDFYILGAKSYGRNSNFLIERGLSQIRDLFTIIGDRRELDLYANSLQSSE